MDTMTGAPTPETAPGGEPKKAPKAKKPKSPAKKVKKAKPAKKGSAPKAKKAKPARKAKAAKKVAPKAKKKAPKKVAAVVERPCRLDMRLTKGERAKLEAKAKRTKRTITSVVLEAIHKIK